MPIIQDGRLLGVLSFVSARPPRLGPGERELLDTLVGQAALAMRNARLFAATEEREREASALFDITRRLGATLDVEEILDIVAEGTIRAMASDATGFLRWDEASQRLVVARAVNYPRAGQVASDPPGEGVSGRAYAERRVCWTDDPRRTRPSWYLPETAAAVSSLEAAGAYMAAPVILRDGVYGVLLSVHKGAHTHTEAESRLLTTLASQAAAALENARLLEVTRRREAEVAQKSALLETTLESMGQGLVAFDGELRLAAWNSRMVDIMGVTQELAWMGRPLEEFLRMIAERGSAWPRSGGADRGADRRGAPVPAPSSRAGIARRPHPSRSRTARCAGAASCRHPATSPSASGPRRSCRQARGRGRGGEPGQERVPGDHEPRDPHADERRDRHDRAAARHRR